MQSIVRSNPGEGSGPDDRPYPLTPTLSPWERGRTFVAARSKQNTLHRSATIDAAQCLTSLVQDGCAVAACGGLAQHRDMHEHPATKLRDGSQAKMSGYR